MKRLLISLACVLALGACSDDVRVTRRIPVTVEEAQATVRLVGRLVHGTASNGRYHGHHFPAK